MSPCLSRFDSTFRSDDDEGEVGHEQAICSHRSHFRCVSVALALLRLTALFLCSTPASLIPLFLSDHECQIMLDKSFLKHPAESGSGLISVMRIRMARALFECL